MNIFVDKSLQMKFVLFIVFLFSVAGIVVWRETYHTVMHFVGIGLPQDEVLLVMGELRKVLLIKMAVELGLVVVLTLVFSHVIAGPIYRLKQAMESVSEGDYSVRLSFRRLDELKSLADSFNRMMDRLSQKGGNRG